MIKSEATRICAHHLFKILTRLRQETCEGKVQKRERQLMNKLKIKKNFYLNGAKLYKHLKTTRLLLKSGHKY